MGKREYSDDDLHWYALDVVRQKEYVAGYIFNQRGCMTFIPTETRFRKKNRYTKGKMEVAHAEIPGTIFVGFPSRPDWYRVMSMHLVNGVLSTDNLPRRIDTTSSEWIRYRSRRLDGQLVVERQKATYRGAEIERSAALVHVQGRGLVRVPWSMKSGASMRKRGVIKVKGERARMMEGLFGKPVDIHSKAA